MDKSSDDGPSGIRSAMAWLGDHGWSAEVLGQMIIATSGSGHVAARVATSGKRTGAGPINSFALTQSQRSARLCFFSAAGFTAEAIEAASDHGIALLRWTAAGFEPANPDAMAFVADAKVARLGRLHAQQQRDREAREREAIVHDNDRDRTREDLRRGNERVAAVGEPEARPASPSPDRPPADAVRRRELERRRAARLADAREHVNRLRGQLHTSDLELESALGALRRLQDRVEGAGSDTGA